MQNPHDDNYLDDLSRQAADEYQPDQDLHSWESLRPGLDAALPQKKERKRRFLVIFLLFLLIGGGVVFSTIWNKNTDAAGNKLTDKSTESRSTATKPEHNATATPATGTSDERASSNENKTPTVTNSGVTDQKVNEPANTPSSNNPNNIIVNKTSPTTNSNTTNTAASTSKGNTSAQIKNSTRRQPQRFVEANNQRRTVRKNNVAQQNETFEQRQTGEQNKTSDQSQALVAKPLTARLSGIDAERPTIAITVVMPGKSSVENLLAQAPQLQLPEKATAKKDKQKQSTPLKNRWEFGAVYAPDVSTVRFTHTQKPGINAGLTVAYNISKRFAIQAGALYTTKNYKSYGKDYHPPKGYWTDYVDLETVTADCNMWDIPVNLRYNLAPRKASNLFVSAGLSSYLMQKEDYDFFYYYNGNPVNRYRSYDTDNKHWFGVLNLSVGYERQVSKNISLQAEPFFKQPLKGVGFGSVKLNTTGIYFSVKYKPLTAAARPAKALR